MNEIDLVDAVAAARRVADAAASDGIATRRRIRTTLEGKRDGRARRFTIVGAVVATLFGSTAFAYYGKPWRHEHVAPTAPRAPAIVDTVDDIEPPRVRERVVVVEKPAATVEPPAEHVESRIAPVDNVSSPTTPATTTPATTTPATTTPQPDPELAAYRVAYDAHFHGGTPTAALAAWDAYLAAYPDGKLASDARYNRAIMLVKLKRFGEAAEALRPLANTRADAARLLNALPH